MDLSHFSNRELLSSVQNFVGEEREATAKLVACLGEVEERRLHLEAGFSSMFAFCTRELGMSENEAFRRLVAARLGRRFPVIHLHLASGAVHLSALELLREHLTEDNHVELLEAVSRKSKHEVQALLALRFPKPDVPSTIRKLQERIEPLSEARYRVEFTASAELREKLELCRDLMSHANPGRELSVVVDRAVDLLLAELARKRLARTKRSREKRPCGAQPRERRTLDESSPRGSERQPKSGRIARATRRQVFERDGLRCTFVSPEGRGCDARAFLELDHVEPRALGGSDDSRNLRVRCRAHNQLAAERVFGRETVDRCRHFVRQKRERDRDGVSADAREERRGDECEVPTPRTRALGPVRGARQSVKAPSTMERVRSALKGMGFRDVEARRAVARVIGVHEDAQRLSLETALREALLAATADNA
jgi:5-methylcytosine-specific restriction endonuclease McrA